MSATRIGTAAWLGDTTPPRPYAVKVPAGVGRDVAAALAALPAHQRLRYVVHRVGAGETVASLARRYSVSEAEIRTENGLSTDDEIGPGASLVVPRSSVVMWLRGDASRLPLAAPLTDEARARWLATVRARLAQDGWSEPDLHGLDDVMSLPPLADEATSPDWVVVGPRHAVWSVLSDTFEGDLQELADRGAAADVLLGLHALRQLELLEAVVTGYRRDRASDVVAAASNGCDRGPSREVVFRVWQGAKWGAEPVWYARKYVLEAENQGCFVRSDGFCMPDRLACYDYVAWPARLGEARPERTKEVCHYNAGTCDVFEVEP